MTKLMIAPIPLESLGDVWPHVEHLAERLEQKTDGEHTRMSLLASVLEKGHQLWVCYDDEEKKPLSILTTFIAEDGSQRKIGVMLACGGEVGRIKDWAEALRSTVREYFREQGCHKSTFIGPYAWKKFFPDMRTSRTLFEEVL